MGRRVWIAGKWLAGLRDEGERQWGQKGCTFDHAQTRAENGNEGDGAGEDLAGLEIEAQRCLVLWLEVVSKSPVRATGRRRGKELTNSWARGALESFGKGLAAHDQGNVVYQGLDIAGWCVV